MNPNAGPEGLADLADSQTTYKTVEEAILEAETIAELESIQAATKQRWSELTYTSLRPDKIREALTDALRRRYETAVRKEATSEKEQTQGVK